MKLIIGSILIIISILITMIVAFLALIASAVSIFLTVYYNKKKTVPVAANGATDTETDDEE